jgi:hypothetical protein
MWKSEKKNHRSDRCKFHYMKIILQYKKIMKPLNFLPLTYSLFTTLSGFEQENKRE